MPTESLTLADIAACLGLPEERVRYVLDQRLLPGLRARQPMGSRGRGHARSFTRFEAFGIVCSVLLLEAGLRRQTVMQCLDMLCQPLAPRRRDLQNVPLYIAYTDEACSALEIGDGVNVRLLADKDHLERFTRWRQARTGAEVRDYAPVVVVALSAGQLRTLLAAN